MTLRRAPPAHPTRATSEQQARARTLLALSGKPPNIHLTPLQPLRRPHGHGSPPGCSQSVVCFITWVLVSVTIRCCILQCFTHACDEVLHTGQVSHRRSLHACMRTIEVNTLKSSKQVCRGPNRRNRTVQSDQDSRQTRETAPHHCHHSPTTDIDNSKVCQPF